MMMKLIPACAALIVSAAAAQADLIGVFQTAPNDDGNVGHVEFYDCGGLTCGKLIRSYNSSGQAIESANIGKNIVWDMATNGENSWSKGRIWDPGADKTYRSKMKLEGTTLKVSGCVGPICRANSWVRVK
ncbi:MAG: DUF2147 domain-containing protein [Dinoroseobacter sp.]|nr:DUF2147 domain-containing protein [Dinoroseobacter sp.]MDJ0992356.1 DUF2147 domain-containing protein [Dinoroseobacter sp.]